jgi:hypothetical protein
LRVVLRCGSKAPAPAPAHETATSTNAKLPPHQHLHTSGRVDGAGGAQLRAAAERMLNEEESKRRGGKAPSRSTDTRPSQRASSARTASAWQPSVFNRHFVPFGSKVEGTAGASGGAARVGRARAPDAAEDADMARRKAEAEARRARENQQQQRTLSLFDMPLCSVQRERERGAR